MGVYIKGMEMPQSCWDCPLINTSPCPCKGYSTALEHVIDRHADCPLVPVPPHGRLIDAGELRELYEEWENDKKAGIDIDKCHVPIPVIRQNIDDAPTVIEAEEGE